MLVIEKVRTNKDSISFKIVDSIRQEGFAFYSSYITISSDYCPEYTGDILFIWGKNAEADSELVQIPKSKVAEVLCSIANYNLYHHNIKNDNYVECCGTYWLDKDDCRCNNVTCAICGETINKKRSVQSTFNSVVKYSCLSHGTQKCSICGELVPITLQHPNSDLSVKTSAKCCSKCYMKNIKFKPQLSYSHKPAPIYYDVTDNGEVFQDTSHNCKYFTGHEVEQQIEEGICREYIIGIFNKHIKSFAYCKHDGSIGYGTELVTHPFSWEYYKHMDSSNFWNHMLNPKLVDYTRSSSSVGHHVHINKAAFSKNHLYKFLKFHHTHLEFVAFISERELGTYNSASGNAAYKAVNKRGNTKYDFINITNHTVEWRAFTSPLTIDQFKKNNEYLYAVFCWSKKEKELTLENLLNYIKDNNTEFPNLYKFITNSIIKPSYYKPNKENNRNMFAVSNVTHCNSCGSVSKVNYTINDDKFCEICFNELNDECII